MHKISDTMNSKKNKDHGLVIAQTKHTHAQSIITIGGQRIYAECIT